MKTAAWLPAFALLAAPFVAMAEEAAPQEIPAVLKGLRFQREEATQWYILFGFESEGKWKPIFLGLGPDKKRIFEKDRGEPMLSPGEVFFRKGSVKGRFKFIGIIDKEVMSRRTNSIARVNVAIFEDLKPNKRGRKYESQYGLPDVDIPDHAYYDRTAVFTFKSEGEAETAEFKIEELTDFALPPGAPDKTFFLKEVNEEKVVVEFKDQAGAVRSVTIPKHVKDPVEALEHLSYLRDESVLWYVSFGLEHEGQWAPKLLTLGARVPRITEPMVSAVPMIKPGDTFFEKDPMKGRFKFNGFVKREVMNRRTNSMEKVSVAIFEDLKPNKKGLKYESQYGLPEPEIPSHAYYDRTAVLSLKVAGKAQAVEFKIEELTNFALPPQGADKAYFLKEVTPEKVVVEYKDQAGALQTFTLPKRVGAPAAVYKMLVIPKNAEQLAVLDRLEKMKRLPKGVAGKPLAEAIDLLSHAGIDGKEAAAVINFVIRGKIENAPKVTLPEKECSFLAAIDEVCEQAGFRWTIEINEDLKRPLLVLFHKDDRQ